MRWLSSRIASGYGLVTRKTNPWLEACSFQLPHPFLWEMEGAGGRVNNQICLCDEVSIKIPELQGSKIPWVGEHIQMPERWHTPTPQGQRLLYSGPFWTSPYISSTWLFICTLYCIKTDKHKNVFLWVLWAIPAIIIPKEGVLGTPIYNW